jgi:hypothetical protein
VSLSAVLLCSTLGAGTGVLASTNGRCQTAKGQPPAGWHRAMSDSFSEDIALGEWGKVGGKWQYPGGKWRARAAGATDTSGRGVYDSPRTTSQHDGLLDVWIHSENGTRYVSAPIPLLGDRRAQRIRLCMRADQIPGYKIAFMLWPKDGPGNYRGEIDFPENKLLRSSDAMGFMHYDPKPSSGKDQDWFDGGVNVQGWHVYTIKWRASTNSLSLFVDGHRIGHARKSVVPSGAMHYIMQMETYTSGSLPAPGSGHVKVDWFTIDVPN